MTIPSMPCSEALLAIEADPLDLAPAVEAHLRTCVACSEARVNWLAMEEAPQALAPAGYFDHLPDRILRKLPAKPVRQPRHSLLWALAAGLLLAVGATGFYLGRVNRQPLVEATLAPAPQAPATLPEVPFAEGDDVMAQVHTLSPEESKALLDRLEPKEGKP
jgi:anti-sigma factor RsiW